MICVNLERKGGKELVVFAIKTDYPGAVLRQFNYYCCTRDTSTGSIRTIGDAGIQASSWKLANRFRPNSRTC